MISTDVTQRVFEVKSKIARTLEKLDLGSLTFHFGGRPARASRLDIVRIISQIPFEDPESLGIRNIILEAVLSGESRAVGSGYLALSMFLSNKKFKFTKGKSRLTKDQLQNHSSSYLGSGLCARISKTIPECSSINSNSIIKVSEFSPFTSIRSIPSVVVPGEFSELFQSKREEIKNSAIVIVDGIVEKISEIDTLLQSASRDKKSVSILASGFGQDVAQTLYSNYKSGNFYVFPIKIHFTSEVLLDLKEFDNFFDVHSYFNLITLNTDMLNFENSVYIKEGRIEITGGESISRKNFINIPSHYKNMSGLIEDRVQLGSRYIKELAQSGVYFCEDLNVHFSRRSSEFSCKVFDSLQKNIDSLGCTILQG